MEDARAYVSDMLSAMHNHRLLSPGPIGGVISLGFYFTMYNAGPFESAENVEAYFDERQGLTKDFDAALRDARDFSGPLRQLVLDHMDLHHGNFIIDSVGNMTAGLKKR
jgi:hypothetical protein